MRIIFRYFRFLISSLLGLIFVILTPFRNLFNRRKIQSMILFLIIVSLLNIIILKMNGN